MKAIKDHLEIAKPKESAPKTRATARRTDSKTCLTPQERGKAQHSQACAKLVPPERGKAQRNQQRAWESSRNSPWNAAPPHYATLPRCVHTQSLNLSLRPNKQSLPLRTRIKKFSLTPKVRHNSTFSPPCWQGTRQGDSPCLDAPPGNMPWSTVHACLKASRYRTRAFARVKSAQHMRVHIQRQCMEKLIRIYLYRSWESICHL